MPVHQAFLTMTLIFRKGCNDKRSVTLLQYLFGACGASCLRPVLHFERNPSKMTMWIEIESQAPNFPRRSRKP